MMATGDVLLIVEGKKDKDFLTDYIDITYNIQLSNDNFLVIGGYGEQWANNYKPKILEVKIEKSLTPIVIFDADIDFEDRSNKVASQIKAAGLSIDYFLFPDNKSPGTLETAIFRFINPRHSKIPNCFDAYCECVRPYPTPNSKSKLFAYLEILFPKAKTSSKINFKDTNAWSFTQNCIPELDKFLDAYFK